VLVGAADRAVWSLRARSGGISWRQRTGSIVTARTRAIGGLLYVPCWDNDVYVLRERNGHLLGRVRLDHRLNAEVAWQFEHLFVAPYTEGSLVALALPYLGTAGKHDLGVPGEWFTTAPVPAAGGIAVGWGRDSGHLLALRVGPAKEPEAAPPSSPAEAPPPGPAP
jgi:outer membrane protein assembly factor BamB